MNTTKQPQPIRFNVKAVSLAVLLMAAGGVQAAISVSGAAPSRLAVAPGQSATMQLRGTDLDQVSRVLVYENRQLARNVNVRFSGPTSKTSRQVTITALPGARPGASYQLVVLGGASKPTPIATSAAQVTVIDNRQANTNLTRAKPVSVSSGARAEMPRPGQDVINGGAGLGVSRADVQSVGNSLDLGQLEKGDGMAVSLDPQDQLPQIGGRVANDAALLGAGNTLAGRMSLEDPAGGMGSRSSTDPRVLAGDNAGGTGNEGEAPPSDGLVGDAGEAGLSAGGTVAAVAEQIIALGGEALEAGGAVVGAIGNAIGIVEAADMVAEDLDNREGPRLETGVKVGTVAFTTTTGFLMGGPVGAVVGAAAGIAGTVVGSYAADADKAVDAKSGNPTKEYAEGYIPPEDLDKILSPWTAQKMKEREEASGRETQVFGAVDPVREDTASAGDSSNLKWTTIDLNHAGGTPYSTPTGPDQVSLNSLSGKPVSMDKGNIDPPRQ